METVKKVRTFTVAIHADSKISKFLLVYVAEYIGKSYLCTNSEYRFSYNEAHMLENLSFGFPNQVMPKKSAQLQRLARIVKFGL